MTGKTVAQYKILELLGAGGMGVVYKAHDTRLNRLVALKFLPEELSRDRHALERFRREARVASALNHPHICTIYDVAEHQKQPFIVMEFLEGDTLDQHCSGRSLKIGEILELSIQIVDALDAAHSKGIVHRDVKPANILLTERGQAKVLDFGVAKLSAQGTEGRDTTLESEPPLTRTNALMGTVAYMSPEQARGEPIDTRSDLFSFGSVLYEMSTGRQAFAGNTPALVFDSILNKTSAPPGGINPDLPAALEAIIQKALQKNLRARYQSAGELLADLRQLKQETDFSLEARRRFTGRSADFSEREKLGCVIVDDEEPARAVLKEYLSRFPEIEVLAECSNGFEAVKAVTELKPDLLFLDIQMPKLNGFEVLELIERNLAVIFITAYDEYALKAFEVHAVDYLLKPFSPERLAQAIGHAREKFLRREPLPASGLAASARVPERKSERILVRDGSRVHVIAVGKIDYVEAQDDYVCIKSGGKDYLKQQTLNELEALLDTDRFIRIHRSYILNVERMVRLELYAKDSRVAILADGTKLPVSRSGYGRLKPLL
jgi:serine/threonine protein kinase